ncbi:hypothetical protein [Candidatus Palauibacter sp.]|uniref:hypothetical protein n=1 Tax=Candidatus Palauibacter sp. TaxID=3101350 RepID=UPI003B524B07
MATKILLVLFSCFLLACRDAVVDRDRPLAEVRDSAGIRIVENRRLAETSRLGWRVGPEPSVSIGALDGEEPYLLHWATATMLPDGRIAVANAGSNEVRLFDRSGDHLATWGGQGEGPGEFSFLSDVAPWPGDSLVAWYSHGLSISVFDASGNFGRSFSLQSAQTESWQRPRPVAARPDGTILSLNAPEAADTAVVEIWDGDGTLGASLGVHPNWTVFIETNERGNRELSRPAYGSRLVVAPWGELVAIGHTSRYEIKAFRGDGALARIVRRDDVLRTPRQADLEPYVEAQMSMLTESPYPAELLPDARRSLESTPLAETFPAFSSVVADATGNLWVREYDYPREERPAPLWSVFDPEGRILGLVETPRELAIRRIGEDYVLGWTRDDYGVEYIQVWPLDRSAGGNQM